MNSTTGGGPRLLGSLRSVDGTGVVRMEDRLDTDLVDAWSALTEPARLARWLGRVDGDLRVGGTYTFHFSASGAEGTGRVDACEPPRHFRVSHGIEQQVEHVIEATLTADVDGDGTILVIEERGLPLGQLAAYGAGIQIHVEDLASHLMGGEPCDAARRWEELEPSYRPLAADVR